MFTKDPFQIYHDTVNKNIERMKREKKLPVLSHPVRSGSQKRRPLADITSLFNKQQSSKVKKPIPSTRKLLSRFETKPKREIPIKRNDFALLENRGVNNKYSRISKEFTNGKKDPLLNRFVESLGTFVGWFRLNKFQYKVDAKDGQPRTKRVITEGIIDNTLRSNYARPEYSKLSTHPTHRIAQVNKLSDFMYVVKVCNDGAGEKVVMLMSVGDCEIKVDDRINLDDLSYEMDYKGEILEVYIRWHLVT
ncbi:hypothetical protein Cantr_08239 [Candida viswanathii]|uniref:Uncharacterized protein n=1 Tax=Candida viswanathii TaxID=5486 RepID=A0A367Y755_9ASCO|nr:hypothetical protein Cantr_08239 [Candida viswanathii]